MDVCYTLVNCNRLTPSLQFGTDLRYSSVAVDKISTDVAHRAVRPRLQYFFFYWRRVEVEVIESCRSGGCVCVQGVLSIPCKSLFNPTHRCKGPAVITFRVSSSLVYFTTVDLANSVTTVKFTKCKKIWLWDMCW